MNETQAKLPETLDVMAAMRGIASESPVEREQSRQILVQAGTLAVVPLVQALTDPQEHVRWEAAKALEGIADPTTVHPLTEAMDDESGDVRWVAAEALLAIGCEGVRGALTGLLTRSRSVGFRHAAHHVLASYSKVSSAQVLRPVLDQLEGYEPGATAPNAAYVALSQL